MSSRHLIQWTLDSKEWTKSIFTGRKMKEYVDIKLIYGFIRAEMGISFVGIKRYKELIECQIRTELDMIINYKNIYDKKNKYFKVGHVLPKHHWGRVKPCSYLSLSIFHRPTRHRLCDDIYIDLDMRNCHASIIYDWYLSITGEQLYSLGEYNLDPKRYRRMICEHHGLNYDDANGKNIAKNLCIRLLFGGSYKTWIRDNNIIVNDNNLLPLFQGIEREMSMVMEIVYTNNKHIVKTVLKHDKKKWETILDEKRGVMALWAQTIERRLMEDVVLYLTEQHSFKLEDIVPCQDGLMILKSLYYDGIVDDINRVAVDNFGLENIRWEVKPFDEAIEIPLHQDIRTYVEWMSLLSAKSLADKILEMRGQYICHGDKGLFVYHSERWYNETEYPKRAFKLRRYISEDLYEHIQSQLETAVELSPTELDKLLLKLRDVTSNGAHIKDIIDHICSKANPLPIAGFDNNPYLLGFENGVMELKTKTFRQYKFDDYMTLTVQYDYREPVYTDMDGNLTPDGEMRDLLKKILYDIHPDIAKRDLVLQILSSGLDGINYQKFFCFSGMGANGKGLLSRFMRKTLGTNLCYCPNSSILKDISRANGATPDIAELHHKRYVIFSELGGTLCRASLRRLTGGDGLTARQLHEKNKSFALTSTYVSEFNNPPEFDVKPLHSDKRRIALVSFESNFSSDPTKIGKTIAGIKYLPANEYYDSDEFITQALTAFLDILLDVYKKSFIEGKGLQFDIPECVRLESEEFVDNGNMFKQVFDKLYEPSAEHLSDIPENKIVDGKSVKHYINRVRLTKIWESISNDELYQLGKRVNPRQFQREYGQKQCLKWLEDTLEVHLDKKNNVKYVLGWKRIDEFHGDVFGDDDGLVENE